ncbi:hypothetical protein ACIBHX_15775 [Nonomuraea sp. NPDC050536]|uniref:hypothetical protein n=1 Tax=Nonomuraea sp. NPDC050536 TaxID=3364366 RepID=UPI0037C622B9
MNMALKKAVAAVLFAWLVLLLGAPAAYAHGGPIVLEVAGDGSHGVNIVVTWKKDRHPVRDAVVGTVTATSTNGGSFGPVRLVSAPEGQNLYNAAEPLPSGEWRVTVTTTEPTEAKKIVNVVARDITAAPEPAQAAPPSLKAAAATDTGSPAGTPLTTIVVVVVVGVAAAVVIGVAAGWHLLRRYRS